MHTINVSIVYATREQQWRFNSTVPRGTNALELVHLSGIKERCHDLNDVPDADLRLGVFAQKIEHDHLLEEGERVEIYRPLEADPKEVRRQLALIGKTMGKKLG